ARRLRERPPDPGLRHWLGPGPAAGSGHDGGIRRRGPVRLHGSGGGAFRALCAGARPERARAAVQAAQTVPAAARHLRARPRPRLAGARAMITPPAPTEFKEDRKSTRLNSSHQIISYA